MNALEGLYSDELVDTRNLESEEGIIRKYYKRARQRIGDYFSKKMGRMPYFGDLKIGLAKLPTYFSLVKEWGKLKMKPVGKVFGMYSPESNTVLVDPVVFKELADPERRWLRKYMDMPSGENVIGHEMLHCDQENTGILERLYRRYGEDARGYIEGAVSYVADSVFGESGCYTRLKEGFSRLVDRIGLKRAYQTA